MAEAQSPDGKPIRLNSDRCVVGCKPAILIERVSLHRSLQQDVETGISLTRDVTLSFRSHGRSAWTTQLAVSRSTEERNQAAKDYWGRENLSCSTEVFCLKVAKA